MTDVRTGRRRFILPERVQRDDAGHLEQTRGQRHEADTKVRYAMACMVTLMAPAMHPCSSRHHCSGLHWVVDYDITSARVIVRTPGRGIFVPHIDPISVSGHYAGQKKIMHQMQWEDGWTSGNRRVGTRGDRGGTCHIFGLASDCASRTSEADLGTRCALIVTRLGDRPPRARASGCTCRMPRLTLGRLDDSGAIVCHLRYKRAS